MLERPDPGIGDPLPVREAHGEILLFPIWLRSIRVGRSVDASGIQSVAFTKIVEQRHHAARDAPVAELTGLVWPRTHQSARLQERKHFLHRGIVVEAVDDVLDAPNNLQEALEHKFGVPFALTDPEVGLIVSMIYEYRHAAIVAA